MTRRFRPIVLLTLLALSGLATAAPAGQFGFLRGSNRSNVSIRLDDGRTVTALVFETNQKPAAAVILVPMLGRPTR